MAQLVGALASQIANRNTYARSMSTPCQGEASSAKETVPAREAHMSTGGFGKRSAAQPSIRYMGTVKNNCKPNMNAAVCSETPLLAMIGMICTVTPAFAIRRNARSEEHTSELQSL